MKKKTINDLLSEYNITKEWLYDAYITRQLSLPKIKKEKGIPYSTTKKILEHFKIPIRNISESRKTDTFIKNQKQFFEEKYGKDITNVSQLSEVKEKKRQTFIKKYGVDNCWKSKEIKENINNTMLKLYGKLRITDPQKVSESLNKFYSDVDKKNKIIENKKKENLKKYGKEWFQQTDDWKLNISVIQKNRMANMTDEAKQQWLLKLKEHANKEESKKLRREINKNNWESKTESEKIKVIENLRKGRKGRLSGLESRIHNIFQLWKSLGDFYFKYQFYINGKSSYDFLIYDKLILEVQGDFWHANPQIYKESDILPHPYGNVLAKDLWKKDEVKKQIAIDNGYEILYLWENEINHIDDDLLETLIYNKILYETKICAKD